MLAKSENGPQVVPMARKRKATKHFIPLGGFQMLFAVTPFQKTITRMKLPVTQRSRGRVNATPGHG